MSDPIDLVLLAPLSGVVVPLDAVPDPVFANKMVGDGVSIDPVTASLTAPCDGRVVQVHPACHAVTLAASHGLEILMHIGLDTVHLKGRGFTPRVKAGDAVHAGDVLIEFDADYVATHARSLLTEVVVTSGERVAAMRPASGSVTAGADTLLHVTLNGGERPAPSAASAGVRSEPLVIANPSGLHARPAALLASRARQFSADVRLRRGGNEANARSVVAIMALEIACGDRVEIVAAGPDAAEALRSLSQLVRDGLGESGHVPPPAAAPAREQAAPKARSDDPNVLEGVAAAPGRAVGRIRQFRHEQLHVVERADDERHERQALDAALEHTKGELDALYARLEHDGAADKAAIFAAHRELLDDPDLLDAAGAALSGGKSAAFAWQLAVTRHADRLAQLKNELLAGRASDVRDVGRRVLQKLTGVEHRPGHYDSETILVAEELTPSDTATLDRTRVVGLCTTTGGVSSHVSILARSLDIPLVAGIDLRALELVDGTPAIVDGGRGMLRVHPPEAEIARVHKLLQDQARKRNDERAHAHKPATTADGHLIHVEANIGGLGDAQQAVAHGADAVGLLRTEFLFLERSTAPSDEEQWAAYRDMVRALGGRRLVIRTLDIGGDKPLAYVPLPREDNPFLGERGIRVMLNRPELLRAQLRAVLRAAREGHVAVMFPMIATLDEWHAVRDALESERRRLDAPRIEAGIMVEVPSAAVVADRFAAEVDFFSIGTNDLTQYTLAMDRGHPRLAPHVDGLSPAVLRLVDQTVRAARQYGRKTAVCGGIAGDPQAVPLLLGLGVDELSVTVPAIPAVKAQLRRLRMAECRALAAQALACGTAAEVRALVPAEGADE